MASLCYGLSPIEVPAPDSRSAFRITLSLALAVLGMGANLLMIGVDAGDRALIDRLVDDGKMPTLARLREDGVSGGIDPLPGLADDGSWSTFATAMAPGKHGRFHHEQTVPGTYFTANLARSGMQHPPFWKALADAGLRVGVVDVPKAPLAGLEQGIEVADWMPHGEDTQRVTVNPVHHPLAEKFVRDPEFDCESLRVSQAETVAHATQIRGRGLRRRELLESLVGGEDWDFFITALAETHCAGHHFWHYHDQVHPRHDAEAAKAAGDLVAAEYREADSTLGRLIEAAGPATNVFVFSLIGMGPNYSAAHVLDDVLRSIEGPPVRNRSELSRLKSLVPLRLKRMARRRFPGVVSSLTSPHSTRMAFVVPHDAVSGAIRLNMKGREPAGIIEAGVEYDEWCRRITDVLLAVENADTGRPVVREVVRVADAYPGGHAADFADLLAVWDTSQPVSSVRSAGLGALGEPQVDRAGNHTPGGWFTMAGPGIPTQSRRINARMIDLGPTVARVLGVDLDQADGTAIAISAATEAP